MKAEQGYASTSLTSFKFVEKHQLERYHNMQDTLVVFGCYNSDDRKVIANHDGRVIIQWEGLDSKRQTDYELFKRPNIVNVTPLPKVSEYLNKLGVNCHQIRFITTDKPEPQVLKDKVYAYVNKKNRDYYGGQIIDILKGRFPILTADYTIKMEEWKKGICNDYYRQAFLSLQLCQYAGGGFSIVELGLKGVRVVTNVLNLPHTIPWETIEDIEAAITEEANSIGTIRNQLAEAVYAELIDVTRTPGYNLQTLLIENL